MSYYVYTVSYEITVCQSHADFVLADLSATHSILIMREFKHNKISSITSFLAVPTDQKECNVNFHARSFIMHSGGHNIRTTQAFLLLIPNHVCQGTFK